MGSIGYSRSICIRPAQKLSWKVVREVLSRRDIRQALGLAEQKTRKSRASGTTTWDEIFSLLLLRNPDKKLPILRIRARLLRERVDLAAAIPIREEKATLDNIPDILKRQELRELIGARPDKAPQAVVRLRAVLKFALSIKTLPKRDRLVMEEYYAYFAMRGPEESLGNADTVVSMFQERFKDDLAGYGKFLLRVIARAGSSTAEIELYKILWHLRDVLIPEQIGRVVLAAVEDQPNWARIVRTTGYLLYPPLRERPKDIPLFNAYLGPARERVM